MGERGDQAIELGDGLVVLALPGQQLGAEDGGALAGARELGQLGDGGLGAGEIAGMSIWSRARASRAETMWRLVG